MSGEEGAPTFFIGQRERDKEIEKGSERKREREKEGGREREREKEGGREKERESERVPWHLLVI